MNSSTGTYERKKTFISRVAKESKQEACGICSGKKESEVYLRPLQHLKGGSL